MLLDSWAWAEMFSGSQKGMHVRKLMENKTIYSSALTLAEVSFWCQKNGKDAHKYVAAIDAASVILDVDAGYCKAAGRSLQKLRLRSSGLGMIDAIIYVQAIANNLTLVTGDSHFRAMPQVAYIE